MTPDRSPASSPPRKSVDHRSYSHSNLLRSPLRHSHRSATGISTCHGKVSPRRQTPRPRTEDDISNWTVTRLRQSLKARGIPPHRNDNKARLFLLYNSTTNTAAAAAVNPALPASPPQSITASHIRSDIIEQLPQPQPASSTPPGWDQAAGRIQQFIQNTYWGTLDSELYCRIFATCTSLSCELCGTPSHPATASIVSAPPPRLRSSSSHNTTVFNCLSSATPPPPIIPKLLDIRPAVNVPMPKGVRNKGRPILNQARRTVCNNFNHLGCTISNCRLLHVCSFCGGAYARCTCPHNPIRLPAD
ncbi:leucine-rich repeat extensin 2 [Xyrichtys novacula]|uniref:Leucine-rich repeat extensin 2 n=1 Tax=Xyrichtys novacula TaxID=13765 RepID=A0AAV1F8Q6_XYRNO|nr:leucine-rich repeat extensin 2 [Xyrichtys novacula]